MQEPEVTAVLGHHHGLLVDGVNQLVCVTIAPIKVKSMEDDVPISL